VNVGLSKLKDQEVWQFGLCVDGHLAHTHIHLSDVSISHDGFSMSTAL